MTANTGYAVVVIAVCAVCTFLERALPFIIFKGRAVPRGIEYLGRILPMAIMTTLVFYCLKGVTFSAPAGWVPQLAASVVTAALHLWKRNTLLSIAGGTAVCMLLCHIV